MIRFPSVVSVTCVRVKSGAAPAGFDSSSPDGSLYELDVMGAEKDGSQATVRFGEPPLALPVSSAMPRQSEAANTRRIELFRKIFFTTPAIR